MKSSRLYVAVTAVATVINVAPVFAGRIDMNDPRRAVGRESDIRVDAQLNDDTIASGQTIGVIYQIQNLTAVSIAVAEKVCSASYDADSQTVTVAVGSEIPANGNMPKMVIIPAGQKKTFSAGTMFNLATPTVRSPLAGAPRFVRIKVHVLRELGPFHEALTRAEKTPQPVPLTDAEFDAWLEMNETIFLNELPVRFDSSRDRMITAEQQRHSLFRSH